MLRTQLCDMLEIEYPIIQAGMGSNVARAQLCVAVSNAGGLGMIGAAPMTPSQLLEDIKKVRSQTNKPFGVDLIFPATAEKEREDNIVLPDPPPSPMLRLKKELKELGADPETIDLGGPLGDDPLANVFNLNLFKPEMARKKLEIVLEERVPILATGLGTPDWVVKECHKRGIKVIGLVGRVKDAIRIAANGADIIVAQGHEGGGHTGRVTTLVLVPQVVDAVKVPVVAAGGIADGRGLVAALALGACGVWVGTRFLATIESSARPAHKARVIEAKEDSAIWSKDYDGFGHRHIKNKFDEAWDGHESEILRFPAQHKLTTPIFAAAVKHNIADYTLMSAGQSSGMIKGLKTAQETLMDMVEEARAILRERLPKVVQV